MMGDLNLDTEKPEENQQNTHQQLTDKAQVLYVGVLYIHPYYMV